LGALGAFERVGCAHVEDVGNVGDVLAGEWFEGLEKRRVLVGAHHKEHEGSGVELFACTLPHSNTSGMLKARSDDV